MAKKTSKLPFILGFAGGTVAAYKNGEDWLRSGLLALSGAGWARSAVSKLPIAREVSFRFVAGEAATDAIRVAGELNAKGMKVSLDLLGESVGSSAEAISAKDEIIQLLNTLHEAGVDANVSLKPTQLGLAIDENLAYNNLKEILQYAAKYNNWVRIDMEDTPYLDQTLALHKRLHSEDGLTNCGVVIQSYLLRSRDDVQKLIDMGARMRLVKGAYKEPAALAYPAKSDTDKNFIALMEMMLGRDAQQKGVKAAIATHDEKMVEATINFAQANGVPKDAFEFQMLYGIRRELQERLTADGYSVRIYVPFGAAWYPYFMRRLAERPANVWFFASNIFKK